MLIKMNEYLHELLLNIDRPCLAENGWMKRDSPDDFDYDDAVVRARLATTKLSKRLGRNLALQDDFQDAFYWGEISDISQNSIGLQKSLFWIRISSWGNLVATREIAPYHPISKEEAVIIRQVLAEHGFVWIDGDLLLNTPYDGVIKGEIMPGQPAFLNWWERFFEYN